MAQQPTRNSNKVSDPHPGAIKRSIQNKVKTLYLVFTLLAVLIILQILLIQIGPNSEGFKNLANNRFYTTSTIQSNRGNIYDRNGTLLATDTWGYRIRLDLHVPALYDDNRVYDRQLPALCDSLAAMFGGKAEDYKAHFDTIQPKAMAKTGKSRFSQPFPVDRVLNQFEFDRICSFPMMQRRYGLTYSYEPMRHKTHGALASYTISRCIEESYKDTIYGSNGQSRFVWLNASHSRKKPVIDKKNYPAKNGSDIITTIDIDLQDVVDGALRRQIEKEGATFGTAVVVECATGEIRAMSNLKRYEGGSINDDNNYAMRWQGDPGSTFKAVSLMALLEIGGLNLNRIIVCGPSKTKNIEGSNVRDTHIVGEGSGTTTLKGAFIESSNIGFAQTVTEVFKDSDKKNYPNYRRWMEYINSIGFGEVKHIQEIRGYGLDTIKDPSSLHQRRAPWSKKTLTNNAYGYELTMTPLQTLMFYNAVANDGVLVAPMLIKQFVTDGEPGAPTPVKVVNPAICSQQTLRKVQECMEGVVSHHLGTAHELSSLPFKVAGKTGTAQVVQEVGKRGKDKDGKVNAYITLDGSREYLATFVGYFPADDPKYTCIVSLNTFQKAGETTKKIYGSNLALPVFKEITEYIYAHDAQWFTTARRINNPTPKAMAAEAPKAKEGTMPNVKGMGLRDALYTLEQLGLRVKVIGKGSVAEQSIAAGEAIGEGTEVRLTLK